MMATMGSPRRCWLVIVLLSCHASVHCIGDGLPPKVDLGLIIDNSATMSKHDMKLAVDFILRLLEFFSISPGTTRVSLYTVADKKHEVFRFKTFPTRKCITSRIRSLGISPKLKKKKTFLDSILEIFDILEKQSKQILNQRRINLFLTNSLPDAVAVQDKLSANFLDGFGGGKDTAKSVLVVNQGMDPMVSQRQKVQSLNEFYDRMQETKNSLHAEARQTKSKRNQSNKKSAKRKKEEEKEEKKKRWHKDTIDHGDDLDRRKRSSSGYDAYNVDNLYSSDELDNDVSSGAQSAVAGEELERNDDDYSDESDLNLNTNSILQFSGKESQLRLALKSLDIPIRSYTQCVKQTGQKYIQDECNNRCECVNGKLVNCTRVRHEFMALSKQDRQRYLKAYKIMTTTQPYKEAYERFIFMHYKYFCWGIHTREQFLPWHRNYIRVAENMLQEIDCRVKISFWDWSLKSDDPWNRTHIWRSTDDGLGGNGNKYRGYCVQKGMFSEDQWETPYWEDPMDIILSIVDVLDVGIYSQRPVLSYCLRRAFKGLTPSRLSVKRMLNLKPEEFPDFDIQIRHNYHDRLHNIIGGTMCTHYAGNSPEFFMHHAMLDNIWYTWQSKSKKHHDTYHKERNKRAMIGVKQTQAELVDSHNLPGCEAVTYDKLNYEDVMDPRDKAKKKKKDKGHKHKGSSRHKRSADDTDYMAQKSYEYYHKIMLRGWFGTFPNCSRSKADNKRAKQLHEILDKP